MKRLLFTAALVLLPSLASAQVTMYRNNGYNSHLYQFGPRGTSITTTLPDGYGGFNQYHYGPGRAPAFVQPLPAVGYYRPQPYYGYGPAVPNWNYGFRATWGWQGMWAW